MDFVVVAKPRPVKVCVHNASDLDRRGRIYGEIPVTAKGDFNPVPRDAIMVREADNAIIINEVLANVSYYEIIVPKKVMKITFADGTNEKVVLKKGDTFSEEAGIRIAIAKHVGRQYYNLAGIENLANRLSYLKCIDKMISKVMREYAQEQKQIKKLEENQKAIEDAQARKAEKAARKREARKNRNCEGKDYSCENVNTEICRCENQCDKPRDADEAKRMRNGSRMTIRTSRHSTNRSNRDGKDSK